MASSTVVLKFGSSVLHSPTSLPIAVTEIYRHYRDGERVIAVVSAFEGVTDTLSATARAIDEPPDPKTLAVLLSTGEIASAAQLTFSLQRAGVPAQLVDPRDIELTADGERADAALAGVSFDKLRARLAQTPVLVVPGFFAAHRDGGLALLGRGGSDLTALYLASELSLRCVLLKDVDGLYESDPAAPAADGRTPPRRFALADYATAECAAGPLIQGKALRFARERAVALEVTRVGSSLHTRIGEGPTTLGPPRLPRRIRVALLGLGTVGGGVLKYLEQFPERFEVVAALVRTPEKHTARGVTAALLTKSMDEVFARDPEIVVEALPGLDPARTYVGRSLRRELRVVTANKALLAVEWSHLALHLAGPRRRLRYAAAVGGSVPMIETLERLTLRSRVVSLRGVLNGTTNFILDRVAAGETLADAIQRAQAEGFAEANPLEDLSGRDAERKLWILGHIAFGGLPRCELLKGIEEGACLSAEALGERRVRLVAEAERAAGGYAYRLAPQALPATDFLAGTRGAENRLEITTADGRVHRLAGLGAGREPTATAVFADVLDHARVIEAEELDTREAASAVG